MLLTLSTTCSIKENLSKVLSSKTRTFFFPNLPLPWCKWARLVLSWVSDQSLLIGIEMQLLFPEVICWLTCRMEKTIDYVTAQILDLFHQNFMSFNGQSNWSLWKMNTQNLSSLQVFQSFCHKCKNHFPKWCPKEFKRFLCECIITLLKGNLQRIKRHHVSKFQNEIWSLFVKRIPWKRRVDVLASEIR